MKIVIALKQVPARDSVLRVDQSANWIGEDDLSFEVNEPGAYALEEGLDLKAKHGGEVDVLCAGPARATQAIREALAKGADRAIHVEHDGLASLDPLQVASLLADAIRPEAADLILAGLQSDDLGYGQTGVILAELLGIPHSTIVMGMEKIDSGIRIKRELENGWFQHVEMPLPALVTVQSGIKRLERAYAVEHPLLRDYTADGYTIALKQLIEKVKPLVVLFPHTYQVRDFAPKLATALGSMLVSDVISQRVEDGQLILTRQLFQGRLNVDIGFSGAPPYLASLQAGAHAADQVEAGTCEVETFTPELSPNQIRTRPAQPFREAQRAVDLASAERIVCAGRGIQEAENIPLVQRLADALGAELAASRPVCDSGWLPAERQVGSSGQTVAPKLYIAVGVSGAIQNLVGMKGSKTIVAVNKDAAAPIFEIADYGIVGDLFEVVPALADEIRKQTEGDS